MIKNNTSITIELVQTHLAATEFSVTHNVYIHLIILPARRNPNFFVSVCPVTGWFEASPLSSMVSCAHNMEVTTVIPSVC